ncbi:MAG: HNH endonuclease [Legionellales bacterium]|nr:HNH endonuclease [Legionellales bacterium]
MTRKSNKNFKKRRVQILQRDENTCRYCGFHSDKYQEVVNIDHDYKNNTMENMATACVFCAQCFFLDSLTLDNNSGGTIIYLPEFSQADLNHFCRILFSALDKESAYKSKLQSAFLSLKDRSAPVENCFGPESSCPQVFGQGLIDAYLDDEQLNHPLLQNLRLLPARNMFNKQIQYWKQTVFAKVPL